MQVDPLCFAMANSAAASHGSVTLIPCGLQRVLLRPPPSPRSCLFLAVRPLLHIQRKAGPIAFSKASSSSSAAHHLHGSRSEQLSVPISAQPKGTAAVAASAPISTIAMAAQLPPIEQALLLFAFIMSAIMATTVGFLAVSLPTFLAARRVIVSLDKLREIVRSELPGTLAAIRLSGLEINDLTVQLNGLRIALQGMPFGGQTKNKNSEAGRSKGSPIMN